MVYLLKAWWCSMANWQCHNQRVSFDHENMIPRPEHSCTGNCRGHRIMAMATDQSSAIFHSKTWKPWDPNQVAKSSTTRYPISWSPGLHEVPATSPSWLVVKPRSYHQVEVHLEPSPQFSLESVKQRQPQFSRNDPWLSMNHVHIKVGYD